MTAAARSNDHWRLESVTIHHFRGVARDQTYAFGGRPSVLHGNNGVGKSTVALALQWVLFGRFHGDVLPNTRVESFLAPVQTKGKAYAGEVVLIRDGKRLVISRDGAAKSFIVSLGGETWSNEEAETKRDEILGLDMDTFVRAVLLQQSRIRGLLLDEPKERNKALDRLLGMDAAEHLLELTKPKAFADAAERWREDIQADERAFQAQEELLTEQFEEAEATARNLKFLNKDLNPTGLKARYAELGRELVVLDKKYKVAVDEMPECADVAQVNAASKALANGLKVIRVESELKKRRVPVDTAIANLTALVEQWDEATKHRDGISSRCESLVEKYGDRETLAREQAGAEERTKTLKTEMKDANALQQLLEDALAYVKREKPGACPVCERDLPERLDLAARLRARSGQMASAEIAKLQRSLEATSRRIAEIDTHIEELEKAEKELANARKAVERLCAKAAGELGRGAIAENKVRGRLEAALSAEEGKLEELKQAIEVMEADLEAIDERERKLREGLVPVIQKREELARHEDKVAKAKKRHAASEARAVKMETLATQLEAIRKALLSAKQEVATELLEKAAPRAQELYRRLVRQPVFDRLEIQANAKAAKVEYTFQVTTGGAGGTARDARLVLSDGQLTATAMALFFGLAESTAHQLDFLYVDDPTQHLDLPCKEAMAKVMAEMAKRRQVIVSTQDEDFVTFLKGEGFPQLAVFHHIKAWDGQPTVETSVPSRSA
jgi:DNA repair exonuclease SbcCD ATPase subunit